MVEEETEWRIILTCIDSGRSMYLQRILSGIWHGMLVMVWDMKKGTCWKGKRGDRLWKAQQQRRATGDLRMEWHDRSVWWDDCLGDSPGGRALALAAHRPFSPLRLGDMPTLFSVPVSVVCLVPQIRPSLCHCWFKDKHVTQGRALSVCLGL